MFKSKEKKEKKEKNKDEMCPKYQNLAPSNDIDLPQYYDGAFKYIFKHNEIRNVAISGPYDSGKSSVVETYEKECGEKFTYISLAYFRPNKKADVENDIENEYLEEGGKYSEGTIEEKLLNQLIQQIPSKNIPQTNFQTKEPIHRFKYIFNLILSAIIFLGILYFINIKRILNLNRKNDIQLEWLEKSLSNVTTNIAQIFVLGVVIVAALIIVYQAIVFITNSGFVRKISLQINEVEMHYEKDDSFFDKCLNEVLYLFENVNSDVIVFEDLDRFDQVEIFQRLREINTLVNRRYENSRRHKGKVLRFFYLIRDDLFETTDQPKFFDFILPVIPVIDSSNSYDMLVEFLWPEDTTLKEAFLRKLTVYLDDIRLLKNIVNEYHMYYLTLKGVELNADKMFALIVYKNIFPKDFADLQQRKGYVFWLLTDKKEMLIKNKQESVQLDLDKCKEQLNIIQNEVANNIKELDYIKKGYQNYFSSSKFQSWCDTDYKLRKATLEDRNIEVEINNKISQLEYLKSNVESMSVQELLEDTDSNIFIPKDNDQGSSNYNILVKSKYFPLLEYLILNGYIDESYPDYLTYFYPNSLTFNDKVFLRSIYERKHKPYDFKLNNLETICESLEHSDFLRPEAMNFELLKYLISDKNMHKNLSALIASVKKRNDIGFLIGYYNWNYKHKDFVIILNTEWPQFFSRALSDDFIDKKFLHSYCFDSLIFCSEDVLINMNNSGKLTEYISNQTDYLNSEDVDAEDLGSKLEALGVVFGEINVPVINEELLDFIYSKNLYQINSINIQLFLEMKFGISNTEITNNIFTQIFASEEPIRDYITKYMNNAIEAVLNISPQDLSDSKDVVLKILNDTTIDLQNRIKYANRNTTIIDSIDEISSLECQTSLINNKCVSYTVINILHYYNPNGYNSELIEFINNDPTPIEGNVSQNDQKTLENLINILLKDSTLYDEKFEQLVSLSQQRYNSFNQRGCLEQRVYILIQLGKINFNQSNFQFIRNNYKTLLTEFIAKDVSEYLRLPSNIRHLEEAEDALEFKNISINDKLLILSKIPNKISAIDRNYPDEIMLEILKTHLLDSDKPRLYKDYYKFHKSIKMQIHNIAKVDISNIIQNKYKISNELARKLIQDNTIPEPTRKTLKEIYLPK